MVLMNHPPVRQYGRGFKYHRGLKLQSGHGLGSLFASLFKAGARALPSIAKTATKTVAKAANSRLGRELGDVLIDAGTNAAVNALQGKDVMEGVDQSIDQAKSKIVGALKEKGRRMKSNSATTLKPSPIATKQARKRGKVKRSQVAFSSKKARNRKEDFDLLEDSP